MLFSRGLSRGFFLGSLQPPASVMCMSLSVDALTIFPHFSAETATTPVSMLDWQAQQKALKDQDRMSKTETERMLHNYRGETDEISSKLSTIKQEDRKNKQEAARFLHNYRGAAGDIAAKSPKRSVGTHVVPDKYGTADQRQGEESVATLAAGFNYNGDVQQEHIPIQQDASSSPESAVMVETLNSPPAHDSTRAAFYQVQAPSTATDEVPKTTDEDWISVESSTVPSPERIQDILAASASNEMDQQNSFDSGEDTISRAVTEVADNLDDTDDEEETIMTEAQLHASASGGGHVSLRLDVEFSFGLISNDAIPNTDKYLKALSSIAHSLFSENRPAGTGGHAIYNPAFEPFIRFVEEEDSCAGQVAKRQIIHASLPIFIIQWAEATVTRQTVKNILRNSIQDGSLLRLALEAASS